MNLAAEVKRFWSLFGMEEGFYGATLAQAAYHLWEEARGVREEAMRVTLSAEKGWKCISRVFSI